MVFQERSQYERSIMPWEIREPTSQSEAAMVASLYKAATAASPPKETRIISSMQLPLLTPRALLPYWPCEGPPLPRFMAPPWPDSIRAPLYTILKGKKPHKQMALDNVPDCIPDMHCYVLARKLEGDYRAALYNLSSEVSIPSGELQTTMDTAEENLRERLIDSVKQANDAIPASEAVWFVLSKGILYQGAWSVIKALWDLLVNKKIKVHLEIPTRIPGYETDEYIVDDFEKSYSIEAEVKVENLHWHPW